MNRLWSLCLATLSSTAVAQAATSGFEFDVDAVNKAMGLNLTQEALNSMTDEVFLGHHTYDIYVNDKLVASTDVDIEKASGDLFKAKIPVSVLAHAGLRNSAYDKVADQGMTFSELGSLLKGSTVDVDPNMQTIKIVIPQAWLSRRATSIANPRLWNYGQTAFVMNYTVDGATTTGALGRNNRAFASLESRLNIGKWRLYSRSSLSYSKTPTQDSKKFENLQTYATRILPSITGRVTAGNIFTSGRFANSMNIIGAEIGDDDYQLDYFDRSYIPTVSGFADSASVVTVRQDGRILIQREVPPGPFMFDDILGLGAGGTVEVTVQGQDGSNRVYYVPFMKTSQQLRTGRFSWHAATGRLNAQTYQKPFVASGSLGYGFGGGFTAYGSALYSNIYQRGIAGLAADAGFLGGFSTQVAVDKTDTKTRNFNGVLGAVSWQKVFRATGSHLSAEYERALHGSPYSIEQAAGRPDNETWLGSGEILHSRTTFVVNQKLPWPENASLTATALQERFKNGGKRRSLNAALSSPFFGGTVSLGVQHANSTRTTSGKSSETIVSLSLSIPLEAFTGKATRSGTNLTVGHSRGAGNRHTRVGLGGFAGDEKKVSWLLQTDKGTDQDGSLYGSLGYEGDRLSASASYAYAGRERTASASMSGGLVAYRGGVLFSGKSIRSAAIVDVPGTENVRVTDYGGGANNGSKILVTGLNNYQRNEVSLNPDTVPAWVTVQTYTKYAVPADEAIIELPFRTVVGSQAIFTLKTSDGKPLPFATSIEIRSNHEEVAESVADENGMAYFHSAPLEGEIAARWVNERGKLQGCMAPYRLPQRAMKSRDEIFKLDLTCQEDHP